MNYKEITSSDELAVLKEQERIERAEKEGLTHVGKDKEGEPLFIGTRGQWSRYEEKWGENMSEWDEEPQD